MDATIRIDNFRSIESAVFNLNNGMNVLIGPNGVGKTNILHALKFLANTVTNGAALALGKAGGPSRNFRRGTDAISFTVVVNNGATLYRGKRTQFGLIWQLQVGLADKLPVVISESIVIRPLTSNKEADALRIEVTRSATGSVRTRLNIADENDLSRSFFNSCMWASSNQRKAEVFKSVRNGLTETLSDTKKRPPDASMLPSLFRLNHETRQLLRSFESLDEYNIQPESARMAIDPMPVTRMGNDGSGVSEVVDALEKKQFRRFWSGYSFGGATYRGWRELDYGSLNAMSKHNPLDDVLEHLRAAVPSIEGVTTDIDPSTGRRFLVFLAHGERYRAEEVSDGTIKWLCLLIAIFVPRSKVVLLEEPENFMHPWMQQRFVQIAREQARKLGTTVLVSTHSVTVLNALVPDELLLVHRDNGATAVHQVPDKESVQQLLNETSFGLGDYWVSGGIGAVPGG